MAKPTIGNGGKNQWVFIGNFRLPVNNNWFPYCSLTISDFRGYRKQIVNVF